MLIRFWVEGYRCFSQRTEIDLTDKKNYKFGVECVRGDFLDKMVVLGGNNAGKTSFGFAMTDIVSTAGGFTKDIGQRNARCFLNKDSGTDRATFHYELTHKGSVITYEYSKSAPDTLVSESLTVDRNVVFRYDLTDGSQPYFDHETLRSAGTIVPDGGKSVILTVAERNRPDVDTAVWTVYSFARHSLYYMAMWRMDVHIGIIDEQDDAERYLVRNGMVDEFRTFLRDVGSIDLDLVSEDGRLAVSTANGTLPFSETVSRGTMILCRLFCWIRRCRERDALIFFDDFDDMFHYRTAENAIRYIISSNRAQCIFVTHNTGLVSNDFLRPDCCFIMDGGTLNSFASLTDKDIRRGHNLEKMLRGGEFDRHVG